MRYLANRQLHVTLQGTEERRYFKPGDVIPDFDQWPFSSQQALLNTHQVKLDLDPDAWVRKDDADGLRAALSALGEKTDARVPGPPPLPSPAKDAQSEGDDDGENRPADGAPDDEVACDLCPRTFASARALKSHRSKSHGGL